ncbi:MAG TPA: prepilin-type N-terminal cleavage/methylation domain-containing protein [Myxococcus sp.]|nr:prepilin-type N-terminal cleavage/methylation domain-containing protein [Myxococcus sp.]
MRHASHSRRGFTLLEVMIASAIGVVVLAVGLVAGMQMQRRALFEEQTMMAQVTGRAVKELLATDLQRAGLGMGNAAISFGNNDHRYAIESWTEPNLRTGVAPAFPADSTFNLPPTGTLYENLRSDALRLYWGDTRSMVVMRACDGGQQGRIRPGNGDSENFCTAPNPPMGMDPPPSTPDTPAIIVNPTRELACHILVHNINGSSMRINANPGSTGNATTNGPCSDPDHDMWRDDTWMTMRTVSAAYRVNWTGGAPALEYLAPGATTWKVVSRNVERMKIRQAVIDLTAPNTAYRWFPDTTAGRPAIDNCTQTNTACAVALVSGETDTNDAERRNLLRKRVRELEVTLTIRTRRADRSTFDPSVAVTTSDEEGFPKDGFKRRTYSFRVAPRNFAAAGQQIPTDNR